MPGMPAGPAGMPGFGGPEYVYKCNRCLHEIGRGSTPPNVAKCPKCGALFQNTQAGQQARSRGEVSSPYVSGKALGGLAALIAILAVIVGGLVLFVKLCAMAAGAAFVGGRPKRKKSRAVTRAPSTSWDD